MDIFDTQARGLLSNLEVTKCQIQITVNTEKKYYTELEELKRQNYGVKQMDKWDINMLVRSMEKMAKVTKQTFTPPLHFPLPPPFVLSDF